VKYDYTELRPYQEPDAQRMVRERRIPLLYTRRAGKTPTTVVAGYRTGARTWLIICPKNALLIWEDWLLTVFEVENRRSSQQRRVRIFRQQKSWSGSRSWRLGVWNQALDPAYTNVFIMSYGTWVKDAMECRFNPNIIILDEAKRIRNRKSEAYKRLRPFTKGADYVWPMTGTPGIFPPDFWTMLNLCKPKLYGSYWRFVEGTMWTQTNEFGRKEIISIKNPDQWRWTLKNQVITTPDNIGDYLPPITRVPINVEMDEDQERLYKQLDAEMMMEFPDGKLKLVGTALEALVEQLGEMDPHVVIYTPFKQALPWIEQCLNEAGHTSVQSLYGGLEPEEQQSRILEYRRTRGIILCTIRYAQAFSLSPAKESFFLGYEWNPEDNEQAEDRIRDNPDDHQTPIIANYFQYVGTYDAEVSSQVNFKRVQMGMTIDLGLLKKPLAT
jgi:SNF2 family DNA or RNA helicase